MVCMEFMDTDNGQIYKGYKDKTEFKTKLRLNASKYYQMKQGRNHGIDKGRTVPLILYYPANEVTSKMFDDASGFVDGTAMSSIEKLVETLKRNKDYSYSIPKGIIFTTMDGQSKSIPKKIAYKIMIKTESNDISYETARVYPIQRLYNGKQRAYSDPFLIAQSSIDTVINLAVARETNNLDRFDKLYEAIEEDILRPFPYRLVQSGQCELPVVAPRVLPYLCMAGYVFLVPCIIHYLVQEKESKVREVLKMMGVRNWILWTTWFTRLFIIQIVIAGLATMLLTVPFADSFHRLKYSRGELVFLFLLLYGTSTVCMCFCISTFFSSANRGALFGFFFFLCTYFLSMMLNQNYSLDILFSLFNNVAMTRGFQIIAVYEDTMYGLTWDNLHLSPSIDDNNHLTFSVVLLMLCADSVFYCLVTWYVDAVFPGEYGVPHKWYFPCQPSYWCKVHPTTSDMEGEKEVEASLSEYFEKEPENLAVGVRAQNIRKVFSSHGNKTVAVADVSLNAYTGQVTTLLGHNGAGKTTFLSVITGFLRSSGGEAYVNGHSINSDIDSVRQSLGICPQHDILFQDLTVEEHMTLFAGLKGCSSGEIKQEVEKWLMEVGLEPKRKVRAKRLSGGMKRKLSVACCLIANSKIVVLDEPSSGVDPTARSQIWDILKRNKENRTVVLTTHYMEEADKLSDRIAIMAEGRIRCCGSPLFLKGKYGTGYHLAIVTLPGCSVESITKVIKKHVPDATVNTSGDLYYTLPNESRPEFVNLFKELEDTKGSLCIDSFGVSVTTLEDVFIKVGEGLVAEKTCCQVPATKHNMTQKTVGDASTNITKTAVDEVSTVSEDEETDIDLLNNQGDEDMEQNNSNINNCVPDAQKETSSTTLTIEGHIANTGTPSNIYPSLKLNGERAPRQNNTNKSADTTTNNNNKASSQPTDPSFPVSLVLNKSPKLQLQQFGALTIKRIIGLSGSKILLFLQIAFPLLITGLVIAFLSGNSGTGKGEEGERTFLYSENYPNSIISSGVMTNNTLGDPVAMARDLHTRYEALYKGSNGITAIDVSNYEKVNSFVRHYVESKWVEFRNEFIIGMVTEIKKGTALHITAFFNYITNHGKPQAVNAMGNALLHYVAGDDYNIETTIHPLFVKTQRNTDRMDFVMNTMVLSWVVCIMVSILAVSFSAFPIRERVTMFKQIQFLSGHRVGLFWLNYLAIDLLFYMVCVAFLTLLISVTEKHELGKEPFAIFVVFMMYGWAAIPFAYLLAFIIRNSIHAVLRMTIINVALIMIGSLLSSAGSSEFSRHPERRTNNPSSYDGIGRVVFALIPAMQLGECLDRQKNNDYFRQICMPLIEGCSSIPDFTGDSGGSPMGRGLGQGKSKHGGPVMGMTVNETVRKCCGLSKCSQTCYRYEDNIFSFTEPGIGVNLLLLFLHGCLYMLLVCAIDANVPDKIIRAISKAVVIKPTINDVEDSDVKSERDRVRDNEPTNDDVVFVRDLTKKYGSFQAVNGLAFSVLRGQCFGLLGVNGAGKTTSFRMITGQEQPSGGKIFLNGKKGLTNACRSLGFCPQFDGLLLELTVKETLKFFARTRGIPEANVNAVVTELARELMLTEHMAKRVGQLSGGNKRKVSTAVAVIGHPEIIILDEPTCGIDPVARRELWNVLERVRLHGSTLILTSHNMEECEALCTRVGIMVNGTLKCIGTTQHLKSKFSEGCTVIARIAKEEDVDYVEPFTKYLREQFPNGSLKANEQNIVIFMIKGEDVSWANVFRLMEEATSQYHIEDYSVSQTTLEQVFNNFALAQAQLEQPAKKFCCFTG